MRRRSHERHCAGVAAAWRLSCCVVKYSPKNYHSYLVTYETVEQAVASTTCWEGGGGKTSAVKLVVLWVVMSSHEGGCSRRYLPTTFDSKHRLREFKRRSMGPSAARAEERRQTNTSLHAALIPRCKKGWRATYSTWKTIHKTIYKAYLQCLSLGDVGGVMVQCDAVKCGAVSVTVVSLVVPHPYGVAYGASRTCGLCVCCLGGGVLFAGTCSRVLLFCGGLLLFGVRVVRREPVCRL